MAFQSVPDPKVRYQELLSLATKLEPLPNEFKVPEYKVQGCQSQVWVVPRMEEDKVYFSADSDSQLTKGLASLLVQGLSGSTPQEILAVSPDFIEELGLKQTMTRSRTNGFLNMLLLMQRETLRLSTVSQEADNV